MFRTDPENTCKPFGACYIYTQAIKQLRWMKGEIQLWLQDGRESVTWVTYVGEGGAVELSVAC